MLPTTDLLPLDLSTASGQVIDNKTNSMPSSDLEATFSDFMREPSMSEQVALIALTGENLPAGGSQLPIQQLGENGSELSELQLNSIIPMQIEGEQVAVGENPLDLPHKIVEGVDEDLSLVPVNPLPTAANLNDQSMASEQRRQTAGMDPFLRQTMKAQSGEERLRVPVNESILAERQQSLLERQDASNMQNLRTSFDLGLYQGEKLVSEVVSSVANGARIDGGESSFKPNIPFNGIALNGAPIDVSQVRQSSTGTTSTLPSITTTIDVPVMDKAWGNAFQDRVLWMTGRGIQNAEIRLNPAELGPIRVQVSIENDAAQLAFSAQNPITREAIEQMMPKLREMLSESGLSLGGSTVSDGDRADADRDHDGTSTVASDSMEPSNDEAIDISASSVRDPGSTSLIDTFA